VYQIATTGNQFLENKVVQVNTQKVPRANADKDNVVPDPSETSGLRTVSAHSASRTATPNVPDDDPKRYLTVSDINKDDKKLKHVFVAGDIYTILVSGKDTNGAYCLIDMLIPPDGGPPHHRHDFEEMFTVLDGDLEFTFRGKPQEVKSGGTINIPSNAPHFFKNVSKKPAHMLCLCAPAGQDDFFLEVGDLLPSRDSTPPKLTEEQKKERGEKAKRLSAKYKTVLL
jgi:quercetin dioxygenase-like cupin family protein